MEIGTVALRIVCFSRDHKTHLYYAACVVLLIVAAGLRFYGLSENSVWYDEAVAASNSSDLSEVVTNTRHRNSSPLLYPLALWAVQKVAVSAFSIRVLPATASVLTVAALLFLLPRVGVSRTAAFLAALLAALSVAAIQHAQDAREYSIDALLAVLMIAGLLCYLQDGRRVLLCVSLFLAPLLQYGLVLFGAAVIGAALTLRPSTLAAPGWSSYLSPTRRWLKQRIALAWPAGCFLVGCTISYVVTVRYQWQEGGWSYYDYYYYQGAHDAADVLGFASSRILDLLNYHLPQAVAIPAVGVFALMLMASIRQRIDAIAILTLLAIGIATLAALLALYPLGEIRQNNYLGPIIFLAVGVSIHWLAASLTALTHLGWLTPALAVAAMGTVAFAGVGDMRRDNPYEIDHNAKAVLAFLEENVQEGDMVYATALAAASLTFYQDERPNGYHYGRFECWSDYSPCVREMTDLLISIPTAPKRIFFAYYSISMLEALKLLNERNERVSVEDVIAHRHFDVALIANVKEFKESLEVAARSDYETLLAGEPVARADFDIYVNDNTLIYAKAPCVRADTEAMFFLHVVPAVVADLPLERKQYGFDNLDFRFHGYRSSQSERCVVVRALPDYAISAIRTGQYLVNEDSSYATLWKTEVRIYE